MLVCDHNFMISYERLSSDRERKILKKEKKSKNTVERTLELCTTLYVRVVGIFAYYCVWTYK